MSIEFNDGLEVVPYIGTWIETLTPLDLLYANWVVPYIGTWIETYIYRINTCTYIRRTLYRYVD